MGETKTDAFNHFTNRPTTMDLFDHAQETTRAGQPLPERMRPQSLTDFVGQEHLVGEGSLLRHAIDEDRLFSVIFWGPPGSGKTTLARILAKETQSHFEMFSAVLSGVKEVREVVKKAQDLRRFHQKKTVLFVDELHRFNRAQQDAFLPHVESGLITLIGATTENPSFYVIAPLLSRARVMVLKPFTEASLRAMMLRALEDPEKGLGSEGLSMATEALDFLIRAADGDARAALNNLEAAASMIGGKPHGLREVTLDIAEKVLQKKVLRYDKAGEEHYNLISAFHKSLRGSDPDAAIYWLARMLEAGEDPLYVARRMVRFASEDVGNADPQALTVAMSAMEAFRFIGLPEGELALVQAAVYLATAPKSNTLYTAYGRVKEVIEQTGTLPVPLHIRNAPTKLMKDLGYGKDYKYAHDYRDGYVVQDHLPEELRERRFYAPTDRGYEKTIKDRLERWRKERDAVD